MVGAVVAFVLSLLLALIVSGAMARNLVAVLSVYGAWPTVAGWRGP